MMKKRLNIILARVADSRRGLLLWLAAAAALIAQWYLFNHDIDVSYPNFIGTLMKCVGEVALILLPYWFLPSRWRWTVCIPSWLFSAWALLNIPYFRFWDDLLPSAAITMTGNVDSNLIQYTISLLQPHDILWLLIPVTLTIACFFIHPNREHKFNNSTRIWAVVVTLLLTLLSQFSYVKSHCGVNHEQGETDDLKTLREHYLFFEQPAYLKMHIRYNLSGPLLYGIQYIHDTYQAITAKKTLSDDERKEIDDFLKDFRIEGSGNTTCADSLNVVYIIVESLNADVLNRKIGDFAVTPTLDSLANLPGTVLMDNVIGQVKQSGSSDGHLLLMTGLLPPQNTSYSFIFGSSNKFHTIASALPDHHKYMILADEGNLWNELEIFRNFGLGKPKTINDLSYSEKEFGKDGAMFREATAMLDTLRRPFMMTLMTMSMHVPFEEPAWKMPEPLKVSTGISEAERNYLNVTHGFDKYLGEFIRRLPNNTVIFIASDHAIGITDGYESSKGDHPVVFMAVNTSRTEHIRRTVGQVNLYPAVLELLGIKSDVYNGIAPSALDPRVDGTLTSFGVPVGNPTLGAVDTLRRAYHISDLIICGNAFGR